MVLISVLVTFCNQEEYIRQALDGILKQKIDCEYEVLVGLDGKREKSLKILKEYTEKYKFIHVYEIDWAERNCINIEKASANRYNLLKHAKGDYFCILDGDDCYGSAKQFQTQLRELQENPDCIGCAVGRVTVCENGDRNVIFPDTKFYTLKSYIESNLYIHNGSILFRNIFKQGFPKDFPEKILNDTTMTMYMMRKGGVVYVPLFSYRYTISENGIYQGKNVLVKNLYAVLDAEINLQYVGECRKELLKKYKKRFKDLYKKRKLYSISDSEIDKILKFAKENKCRLLRAVLAYSRCKSRLGRWWWSCVGKALLKTKCYSGKIK